MKKLSFLILIFSFLTLTSTCFAQEWVRTYKNLNGGLKDGEDKAHGMVIDSSGFIIVAGYVSDCETGTDICIIKYKPDGDTLWVRTVKGAGASEDKAYAITVDDLDNIYITGITSGLNNYSDIITLKYSPSGQLLWTKTFDGTAHGPDKGSVICIDASRNIYVAGYTTGATSGEDYVLLKYNSSGTLQWFKTYDGPGHNTDIATSIAVNNSLTDCEDFVVISGYSRSGQTEETEDIVTIAYKESNGEQLWLSRVNGSESGNVMDKAYAITVDKNNAIFVAGYSQRSTTAKDIITIAYNYNGGISWKKFYNGPANSDDIAFNVLATQDNNILVCGSSKNSSQYGTEDYITLDYHSNNGTLKWHNTLNGPGNSIDVANTMAISKNGQSVLVTGYSKAGPTSPRYDILTVKYKLANGELQDSTRFNTTGFDESNASAIKLNDAGDIYISGFSSPLDPNNHANSLRKKTYILTLKYNGTLQLSHGKPSSEDKIDKTYQLNQNFPNPFNPSTIISFNIPKDAFTKITIYDMLGREIKNLVSENLSAGVHTVQFDGSNLSSGIYFYELNVNGVKNIKKMMLVK
jgi:uncharacterized delta-60 repeat protein